MTRKGESITLSLDAADKAALEEIALQFGCHWGDRPNISELMKQIARHNLRVGRFDEEEMPNLRSKQGRAAVEKIVKGLLELSAVLFKS